MRERSPQAPPPLYTLPGAGKTVLRFGGGTAAGILALMLLALSVPPGNERGPLYSDQALAAIHQGNPHGLPFTLEYGRHAGQVTLFCCVPPELRAIVTGQFYAQYPDCRLEEIAETETPPATHTWEGELHLKRDLFPIRRYPQFHDDLNRLTADPLTALLTTLAWEKHSRLTSRIQIVLRPARARIRRRAERVLRRLSRPFFRSHHRLAHLYVHLAMARYWATRMLGSPLGRLARDHSSPGHADPLAASGTRLHDREEHLQAAGDKLGKLLFEAQIRLSVSGPKDAAADAAAKLREMAGAFGQFSSPRLACFRLGPIRSAGRRRRHSWCLLSTEELATLFHPATLSVRTPAMTSVESREFPPPAILPALRAEPDLAVLGTIAFRNRLEERFGIQPDDRRRHIAIYGKTGMGKSSLLHRLVTSDVAAGRGTCLIDPHGDLCDAVLAAVPSRRTNDVIVFDPADRAFPIAFNVLDCRGGADRSLVASGVLSAFKKLWADSWGPRLEHYLRNILLTLTEVSGASLLSVPRLLDDARYRNLIVARLTDPVVRAFWELEYATLPAKLQVEAVSPIRNKVGAFLTSPILRRLLGQGESRLNLRTAMDEGKVVLANLSKGNIGEDASTLLGSFLVTALQLAAMSRADVPESQRRDFYVYVDEFQNFATEAFATILSEARKYRLCLTVANQYLGQIPDATRDAVFGNIGTMVCFQVGAQDAELLADQLGGDVTPQDLQRLPRFQAYIRLLLAGMPTLPFSMRTLPPMAVRADSRRSEIVRRASRQRYARPIDLVEQEIRAAYTS